MAKIKVSGSASGTGTVTLIAPATSTDRTITLPDSTGTLLDSTSTLDATKLSGALPAISGASLTGITHTPADNSVTLAKMAHGTDGELITYDAAGAPANVAVGTSGHILTSGGAGVAPTFQAAAAGGDLSFGGDTFGANKTIGSNDNYALSFETNATERLQLTNDGRGLSQFTAKAWCNFDGSGSAASWERDSHNVSSYVDNGTGNYTVNFSNNMANANYSVGIVVWNGTSHGDFMGVDAAVVSTSSIIIKTGYVNATNSSMAAHNVTNVNLLVFGD